jgi:hypothetical protein
MAPGGRRHGTQTLTLVILRAQIITDPAAIKRTEQFSGFGEVKENRLLALSVAFDANARWIGEKAILSRLLRNCGHKDIFMSSEIPNLR